MTLADIRSGLRAYLLADGTISGLVGGSRIYPVKLPQGIILASIVYQRISGQGDNHMQGASGLSRPRLQIDCYAPSAMAAAQLADLVKERIDGFRGEIEYADTSPANSVKVQGVFFDNESDDYDAAAVLYRTRRDYLVWFEER